MTRKWGLPRELTQVPREQWVGIEDRDELFRALLHLGYSTKTVYDSGRWQLCSALRDGFLLASVLLAIGIVYLAQKPMTFVTIVCAAIAIGTTMLCATIHAIIPWRDVRKLRRDRTRVIHIEAQMLEKLSGEAIASIGAQIGGYSNEQWDTLLRGQLDGYPAREQRRTTAAFKELAGDPGMRELDGLSIIKCAIAASKGA